jgi:hypothetical protein
LNAFVARRFLPISWKGKTNLHTRLNPSPKAEKKPKGNRVDGFSIP